MNLLPLTFKVISLIFAVSAIVTGAQAIVDPIGFSRSFGLPITIVKDADRPNSNSVISYVSLMGVRQFATGITLLTLAYQDKWTEMATILAILGIVVAGADGFYLARSGASNLAKFHTVPGALIALLASAILFTNA